MNLEDAVETLDRVESAGTTAHVRLEAGQRKDHEFHLYLHFRARPTHVILVGCELEAVHVNDAEVSFRAEDALVPAEARGQTRYRLAALERVHGPIVRLSVRSTSRRAAVARIHLVFEHEVPRDVAVATIRRKPVPKL